VIHADPIDVYYAFQQESQSHYTFRYLTSTRPNPEHKSVMCIDLL